MAVGASHIGGLHGSVITDHVGVGIFLAVGKAVEVVEGLVLSDFTALRENWVFVLDEAERLNRVVLLDVIG